MDKPCFYRSNQLISFQQFYGDITAARQNLVSEKHHKIMLFHEDSYTFTVLLFALILEKKHVYLPPNKQVGTLQSLAEKVDATVGDFNVENKPALTACWHKVANKHDGANIDKLFANFSGKVSFFTSGSTGQPKEIVKQCHQLTRELSTLYTTFSEQFNRCDIVVSTVSHQHIYGLLFKILLPLRLAKLIVNKTFEYPEHINTDLSALTNKNSATNKKKIILVSSPAHLKRLVIDNVLAENASQYCATFSSGGLLPVEVSQDYHQQMGLAPIEIFGSTETGGIAWRCGQPLTTTPWQLFTDISYQTNQESKRLAIFSPYLDEQPYLTDDCVEYIDEQQFILKGRVDRTVKIEEKRVNLDHLERHLMTHPWVVDAKVFFIINNHAHRNSLCCALITTNSAQTMITNLGKRALNDTFKQHLLTDFERVCLPKKWRYLEKFPYNSQGKILLSDLERLFD